MVEMAAICAGIAANLATVPDCQILAYRKAAPNPPTLMVTGIDEITPTTMQGGGYSIVFAIQGVVARNLDRAAEQRLYRWLSPTGTESVWAALETDGTLGGAVDDSSVVRNDGTQIFQLEDGTEVFGSTWFLRVEI